MTCASVNLEFFVGVSHREISDSGKSLITTSSKISFKESERVSRLCIYIEPVASTRSFLRVIFFHLQYQLLPFGYLKCHLYSRKNC
jgi:hypothetical protein